MDNQLNRMELRRVLAESGRSSVRDMMLFLKHQHEGKYDKELAEEVAQNLVAEIPRY